MPFLVQPFLHLDVWKTNIIAGVPADLQDHEDDVLGIGEWREQDKAYVPSDFVGVRACLSLYVRDKYTSVLIVTTNLQCVYL